MYIVASSSIPNESAVNAQYSNSFSLTSHNFHAVALRQEPRRIRITSIGFNDSTLTPLNYTSPDANNANNDFTFELSFRPIFKVSGSIAGISPSLYADVFADVPKLDVPVSQVTNVTKNCEAAPAGTASNQVFHNLTLVVPTLCFDAGFNATDIPTQMWQLGNTTVLPTSCLDFLPSASAGASASLERWRSRNETTRSGVARTCGRGDCYALMALSGLGYGVISIPPKMVQYHQMPADDFS